MKLKHTLSLASIILFFQIQAQDWAWIGGTQNSDDPGSYGTINVTAPSNIPPGREDFTLEVYEDSIMYLFGGRNSSGNFNDLWQYDSKNNVWTWISGSTSYDVSGTYGTQGTSAPTNFPGSRRRVASTIDNNGNLWIFGGQGYDVNGDYGNLNDLWMYDANTGEWTWVSGSQTINSAGNYGTINVSAPSNVPPARYWSKSWFYNDVVYLFGGISSGNHNDVWAYDVNTQEWTWVSGSSGTNIAGDYGTIGVAAPSNQIGARNSFDIFRKSNGEIFVFGGFGNDKDGNAGYLNDMWMYNTATNEWVWVSGSDTRNATATYGTQGVYDANNDPGARRYTSAANRGDSLFYLFAGFGKQMTTTNTDLSELWVFDPVTNEWAFLDGSTFGANSLNYGTMGTQGANVNPGARRYAGMAFVSPKSLVLFGGRNESNNAKNDLFAIDFCELDFGNLNFTPISCYRSEDGIMEITPVNQIGDVYYSIDEINYSTNNIFENLDTGNYVFHIMDDFGCKKSQEYIITEPDTLIANNTIDENILCYGGTAEVSIQVTGGTPGYNYSNDNINFNINNQFTPLVGTHMYYVQDSNGCLDSTEVTLSEPDEMILEVDIVDSMLCNGDLASVELNASGGTGAYTYSNDGNNYSTNTFYNNIPQGTFTYHVKDDNNCIVSESITFNNPSQIVIVGVTTDEQQGNDGAITINVGGGTPTYDFNWSNGEVTQNLSGLSAGIYTITITDENGCTEEETFEIHSFVSLESLNKNLLQLFPNPSDDFINIRVEGKGINEMSVYDLTGKVINKITFQGSQYRFNHNLSPGTYLIKVNTKDGKEEVSRFVVK